MSSPLLPEAQQRIAAALEGVPLIPIYGMTETTGQICAPPLPPGRGKPGSVGPVVSGELEVRRADGTACATGEAGAVWVRGPLLSSGARPRDRDGWFDTGDLGHLDAEGWLFLTGRAKEMINRGGEKIAPLTVEAAALAHPDVGDAAAYAVPHPTLGEAVALAVTARPGQQGQLAERLPGVLAARLAPFQRPATVRVLDALPRLASGKLDRRALAASHPVRAADPETALPPLAVLCAGTAGQMPVILGCQTAQEARVLAAAIPGDRPVWVLRSLFQRLDKTGAEERAVAATYGELLHRLLPEGPVTMAGFCSGAKVLALPAPRLRAAGRDIRAFISIDHWFDTPFDVPTWHLFSTDSRHAAITRIARLDGALSRLHPAGHGHRQVPIRHGVLMTRPLPDPVCADIAAVLRGDYPFAAGAAVLPSALDPEDMALRLRLTAPALTRPGGSLAARLHVTNTGTAGIAASEDSGLFARAEFLNLDGHRRSPRPQWLALPGLPPGAEVVVPARISVPDLRLPMTLSVGTILDEVADLADRGISPAARLVWPLLPRRAA